MFDSVFEGGYSCINSVLRTISCAAQGCLTVRKQEYKLFSQAKKCSVNLNYNTIWVRYFLT